MSYIKKNLHSDEKLVFETDMHGAVFIITALLGIPLYFIYWPLYFVPSLLFFPFYYVSQIAVTDKRLVSRYGFFTVSIDEIPLSKINNIGMKRGIVAMLLGYGSIYVQSGAAHGLGKFHFVNKPAQLRAAISKQIQDND